MISASRETDKAKALQDSKTLHALADTNRRHILVVVDKDPGITVNEITARLPISRWGVRKHLNVLEAAGLVRSEWDGTYRRVYVKRRNVTSVLKHWQKRFGG